MTTRILVSAALLACSTIASSMQAGNGGAPRAYTGVVNAYSEDSLTLTAEDGRQIVVPMTPGWSVAVTRPASAVSIQAGSVVATANRNVDANTGRPTELRVFDSGYAPEQFSRPMGEPDTTMTNGKVTAVRKSGDETELDVAYPGGTRHLIVGPDVKVTANETRDRSMLKKDETHVSVALRTGADGVARGTRVTVQSQP